MPPVVLPDVLPDFRVLRHRFFPHGYLDAVWQVVLFLLVYYAYRLARGGGGAKTAAALPHRRHPVSPGPGTPTLIEPPRPALPADTRGAVRRTPLMGVPLPC